MARIPTPLSPYTVARISTANAPLPSYNIDGNIGKEAYVTTGVYANLRGILYPPREGVRYIVEHDQSFLGKGFNSGKRYLLMYFYDDGTFFCAIEVSHAEVEIPSGKLPLPTGSGTIADPFTECGTGKIYNNTYGSTYQSTRYHLLPDVKGEVEILINNYYGETSPITYKIAYVDSDGTIIEQGIGSYDHTSPKVVRFYHDPAFNASKIAITMQCEGTWNYRVGCPTPLVYSGSDDLTGSAGVITKSSGSDVLPGLVNVAIPLPTYSSVHCGDRCKYSAYVSPKSLLDTIGTNSFNFSIFKMEPFNGVLNYSIYYVKGSHTSDLELLKDGQLSAGEKSKTDIIRYDRLKSSTFLVIVSGGRQNIDFEYTLGCPYYDSSLVPSYFRPCGTMVNFSETATQQVDTRYFYFDKAGTVKFEFSAGGIAYPAFTIYRMKDGETTGAQIAHYRGFGSTVGSTSKSEGKVTFFVNKWDRIKIEIEKATVSGNSWEYYLSCPV